MEMNHKNFAYSEENGSNYRKMKFLSQFWASIDVKENKKGRGKHFVSTFPHESRT